MTAQPLDTQDVPVEVRELADRLALARRHEGMGDYNEAYLGLRNAVEAFLAIRSARSADAGEVEGGTWLIEPLMAAGNDTTLPVKIRALLLNAAFSLAMDGLA